MLRQRGLSVDLATNGRDAVEAAKTGRYDVVLMDIQMPEMDGYEATAAIRAWEHETERQRVPIIALTAHALPADRARCLAEGMDDFVTKPFSGEALGAVIARWLPPPGQAHGADSEPTLDPARLHEVRQAMGDLMPSLLQKVGEALTLQLALTREAAGRGDALACREAVHRIKNSAGDVGAHRLHRQAADLEQQLVSGHAIMPAIEPLVSTTETVIAALRRAFEEEGKA
jgi:CheY-like chemotaxis protein